MIHRTIAANKLTVFVVLLAAHSTFVFPGCSKQPPAATATTQPNEQPNEQPNDASHQPASHQHQDPPLDREGEIRRGDEFLEQEKYDQAIACFQRVLLLDPNDVVALFKIASAHANNGQIDQAISVINAIPEDHPQAGLPAIGQAADWYSQIGQYDKAEEKYKQVLRRVPDFAMAHRNLAFILNRQGRRHEAAKHLQTLCLLGNIRQDELHALALISDAIYDDPTSTTQRANGAAPLYTPIGPMGEARKLFTDGKYASAANRIDELVRSGKAPPSVVAFYGRAVAEAQDDERFQWWVANSTDALKDYSEYWAAIAVMLIANGDFDPACRALLEAIDRDPTDIRSILRLHTTLAAAGHKKESKIFEERWQQTRDLVQANNAVADAKGPAPDQIADLAQQLEQAGRRIEAVMWRSIELQARRSNASAMNDLNQQRLKLKADGNGFPSQSIRLSGIALNTFAKPKLAKIKRQPPTAKAKANQTIPHRESATVATFTNVASKLGVQHRYEIGTRPQRDGFTIYQTAGGGVAALDFDLDGWTDLCFAQGNADPPDFVTESTNELYRNTQSQMTLVSSSSRLNDTQYTLGITAGDWNQDGFADLAFANIGQNTLWINNGDGTFHQQILPAEKDLTLMPTSIAMADINADSLPDLVEINYAHDAKLGQYPSRDEQGNVTQSLSPLSFQGGQDMIHLNSPKGQAIAQPLENEQTLTGFGVVIADITEHPGNEIFVGNDLHPNQLWAHSSPGGPMIDIATTSGCAFAFSGAATASMGIAAGDFDGNQKLDLHITNFQDQASSLYLNDNDSFRDRNVWMNLAKSSSQVLGFGSQAIDYDNDSLVDLVVTNGNIEDAISFPSPFKQPNQLFANLGNRFDLIDINDASGYWSKKHLGRSLATLDFNRDGNMDFVVTHLNEPSAILQNQTKTKNHFLQLQLIATETARDAIGAKATILQSDRQMTGWKIAGNGYLACNEPIIAFGLNENDTITTLHIDWPNGERATFHDIPSDRRIMIVQGQTDIHVCDQSMENASF